MNSGTSAGIEALPQQQRRPSARLGGRVIWARGPRSARAPRWAPGSARSPRWKRPASECGHGSNETTMFAGTVGACAAPPSTGSALLTVRPGAVPRRRGGRTWDRARPGARCSPSGGLQTSSRRGGLEASGRKSRANARGCSPQQARSSTEHRQPQPGRIGPGASTASRCPRDPRGGSRLVEAPGSTTLGRFIWVEQDAPLAPRASPAWPSALIPM